MAKTRLNIQYQIVFHFSDTFSHILERRNEIQLSALNIALDNALKETAFHMELNIEITYMDSRGVELRTQSFKDQPIGRLANSLKSATSRRLKNLFHVETPIWGRGYRAQTIGTPIHFEDSL